MYAHLPSPPFAHEFSAAAIENAPGRHCLGTRKTSAPTDPSQRTSRIRVEEVSCERFCAGVRSLVRLARMDAAGLISIRYHLIRIRHQHAPDSPTRNCKG